jgi:hypothetical protein
MFSDDQQDYKIGTEADMNSVGITPESIADLQEQAQYDYRAGFNDIDLLASLKGFTEDVPAVEIQDSVSEFIAQSDSKVDFTSNGDPIVASAIEGESEESSSSETMEAVAMFGQDDT